MNLQPSEHPHPSISFYELILYVAIISLIYICFNKIYNLIKKNQSSTVKSVSKNPAKFYKIEDEYKSYKQVEQGLRDRGLERSKIVIGIDFTKSNEWNGKKSFNNQCLHAIRDKQGYELSTNPYKDVLQSVGTSLKPFNDSDIWHVYGFGDSNTSDFGVFPFREGGCVSFEDVLELYDSITPTIKLSGPTSFAPIINRTIDLTMETGEFYILLIIADGEVVDQVATEEAIIRASHYPISIIMVGVGDGPWEHMETYDDKLEERLFDNFQFVNFNKLKKKTI